MKAFIAARPITGVRKKFFLRRLVMTHARHFLPVTVHVQLVAAVLGDERFAPDVSCDRCGFAAIVAGFSIATTAEPSAGIPGCSSAPSDASIEISFRIPSANTPGFAAVVIAASSVALCVEVAFSDALTDLDWGSWEGSLPDSSSLGGDGSPLRGAFAYRFKLRLGIPKLTAGNSINFCGGVVILSPLSTCGGLAHSGPPKWLTLSPSSTDLVGYRYTTWCSKVFIVNDHTGIAARREELFEHP